VNALLNELNENRDLLNAFVAKRDDQEIERLVKLFWEAESVTKAPLLATQVTNPDTKLPLANGKTIRAWAMRGTFIRKLRTRFHSENALAQILMFIKNLKSESESGS